MATTKGFTAGKSGTTAPVKAGAAAGKQEFCHPSVCVGNAKPANCICPTTKK